MGRLKGQTQFVTEQVRVHLLEFLRAHASKDGYVQATVADCQRRLSDLGYGARSRMTVYNHVQALVARGLLDVEPYRLGLGVAPTRRVLRVKTVTEALSAQQPRSDVELPTSPVTTIVNGETLISED